MARGTASIAAGENKATVANPGPAVFRYALAAGSLLYFLVVIIGEWRSGLAYAWVPGPILYFTQVAGLFTESKKADMEFRVLGWSCRDGLFREMDVDAHFPIQAGNKENRFQRAVYFYHANGKVMGHLDRFLIRAHNARVAALEAAGKEPDVGLIGGVRIVSAMTPIPRPEEGAQRYARRPLSDYPAAAVKTLYESSENAIWKRCRERE